MDLLRFACSGLLCVTSLTACKSSQLQVEQYRLAKQIEALQNRLTQDETRLKDIQEHLVLLEARPLSKDKISTKTTFDRSTSIRNLAARAFFTKPQTTTSTKASTQTSVAQALHTYQEGKLQKAYAQLQSLMDTVENTSQADIAHFWMGTCKFELGEFKDAITHFSHVLNQYPKSIKTPEALFKIGLAFENLSDTQQAHRAFTKLMKQYPHSDSAELASKHLPKTTPQSSRTYAKESQHAY